MDSNRRVETSPSEPSLLTKAVNTHDTISLDFPNFHFDKLRTLFHPDPQRWRFKSP